MPKKIKNQKRKIFRFRANIPITHYVCRIKDNMGVGWLFKYVPVGESLKDYLFNGHKAADNYFACCVLQASNVKEFDKKRTACENQYEDSYNFE